MMAPLMKRPVSLAALGVLLSRSANAVLNGPSVGMAMTWACPDDQGKEHVAKVSIYDVPEAAAGRGIVRFLERLGK